MELWQMKLQGMNERKLKKDTLKYIKTVLNKITMDDSKYLETANHLETNDIFIGGTKLFYDIGNVRIADHMDEITNKIGDVNVHSVILPNGMDSNAIKFDTVENFFKELGIELQPIEQQSLSERHNENVIQYAINRQKAKDTLDHKMAKESLKGLR